MPRLSERVRADVEAAPWVVQEIIELEAERKVLRDALKNIQNHVLKVGFIWQLCEAALRQGRE